MKRPNGCLSVYADSGVQEEAAAWGGRRDQSGIDRQSLHFFVKQDLRTIFKSLLVRVHMY